jgi:hypothetical protein
VNKAKSHFVQRREISQYFAGKRWFLRAEAILRKGSTFPPANDGRFRMEWGKIRHLMPSQQGSASLQEVGIMMIRGLFASAVAMFALVLVVDGTVEGGKEKPLAIKVIMKKAHTAPKGEMSLLQKVTGGTADAAEKKTLIALYTDLAANKCPKGDAADWKERTQAILKAAKADDAKALKKAANCNACHTEHK